MKRILCVSILAALAQLTLAVRADDATTKTKTDAPSLETIKQLVGTWVAVDEKGKATEQVVSEYRVTAGGSAIIETLFPGTDKEMISMYHQVGDQLIMTHYCMLGNQPQMTCQAGDKKGQLVFRCNGKGLNCAHDRHMHQGVVTVVDKDHMRSVWTMTEEGKNVYEAKFELVRVKR